MNILSQIVVASPDMEGRRSLATILTRLGLDPICISTVSECRVMLAKENVDWCFATGISQMGIIGTFWLLPALQEGNLALF